MRKKRWNILPKDPRSQVFADQLGISPVVAQILLNRGISEPEPARQFLKPSLLSLHDPACIGNMSKAAGRLAEAIRSKQKIVIYGDYDVDGITGTAILWHAIKLLGGDAHYYIPHRVDEGYGINAQAIEQLCDEGARLIISVDCGITAVDEIAIACGRGVDVILTDHHEWRTDGKLPECFCVVHPRLDGNGAAYPNPHLCGSGVALKLAWATGQQFAGGNGKVSVALRQLLLDATSLAALATIADVVPLVGENRILAHFGLLGLRKCSLPGVHALLESAGLMDEKVDAYHVGFMLAPRLNASGRMGHAAAAVEMLTDAATPRAREIATFLDQQNRERQNTERQILESALAQIAELKLDADEHHAIVVGAEGWHAGVIGIVASRIVDRYHRPAVVISLDGEDGHGSGRSISGFHLARALSAMGDLLEGSGGHEMAAGLRLKRAHFEPFRERFMQHARETIAADLLEPQLRIEAEATLAHFSRTMVDQMQSLGPFGPGNPKPLLQVCGVELIAPPNVVGRMGDHLQLRLKQGNNVIKAIAFKFGPMANELRKGMLLDIVGEPTLNTYNGMTSVEFQVKDLRPRA